MKWSTEDKDATKVTKVRNVPSPTSYSRPARHQAAGAVQRLERPGVGPPAAKISYVIVPARCTVVDVGDLELAAAATASASRMMSKTAGVVQVDAGHGVAALRPARLLLDRDDALVREHGHAEALADRGTSFSRMLRAARLAAGRRATAALDVALDDVVAEDDADLARRRRSARPATAPRRCRPPLPGRCS